MPEIDGFEATACASARARTGAHLPVIAMTAHAMKGDRERCLEAGMDDYVAKPIQPAELWQAIDKVLGRSVVSAAPSPSPTLPVSDVFDYEDAMARVGEDLPLLHELVEVFLTECPQMLADLRKAADRGDASELHQVAHRIKGAVGSLSAPPAAAAALRLESFAKAGSKEDFKPAFLDLEIELYRLQGFLKGFLVKPLERF